MNSGSFLSLATTILLGFSSMPGQNTFNYDCANLEGLGTDCSASVASQGAWGAASHSKFNHRSKDGLKANTGPKSVGQGLTIIPAKSWISLCPDPENPKQEVECYTVPTNATPVRLALPPEESGPPRPLTMEEFKHFPVSKGELLIQPNQGRHTVNMPVIVATTARQHVVSGDLLGFPFHVRFTPVKHAYDYGDGSAPYVTADPNTPYPNNRFWHEWWTIGTKTISVTTTWTGAYQVAGSAWIDVPGTLETTVSSEPQQVDEYHILLTDPDKATGGKYHDPSSDWLKGTPLDPSNTP